MRKILKKIPFAKEIYLYIKGLIYTDNPIFFRNKFDNVACNSNLSFLKNHIFMACNEQAIHNADRDYRFYFRLHQALWCAQMAEMIDGDFLELGTGKGYIFGAVSKYLELSSVAKKIYMFDTFLPYKTDSITGNQNDTNIKSSYYADSYEAVKEKFRRYSNCVLIKGVCPDTVIQLVEDNVIKKIAFLHVDLNYSEAEIASLKTLWPLISKGGIILLDDYANIGREVQNQAFDSFFADLNLPILTTASGQGIVIKNKA